MAKKLDTPIVPRVKIPTWDTILGSDNRINKNNTPLYTKESSKLFTPKKMVTEKATPTKKLETTIKNPLLNLVSTTPRSQIKTPVSKSAFESPIQIKATPKTRKLLSSNSEMSSNSFEESCEYIHVVGQGTQTHFTPTTPLQKNFRRSPSLIILDEDSKDSLAQSQTTATDVGTSVYYTNDSNDIESSIFYSRNETTMETSAKKEMEISVNSSHRTSDVGTLAYKYQETKDMGTSIYHQTQGSVDIEMLVNGSCVANDIRTSIHQPQRTKDMGTSVYQSQ